MSTTVDLRKLDRRLRGRLDAWVARLAVLVESKVADARAHAELALTKRARHAADGRPTLRLVERSPSFQAAVRRLQELLATLAGPARLSNRGLIRDAREEFYRDSFEWWKAEIPAEAWVSPDLKPTRRGVANARGQQIDGAELHDDLARVVEGAIADLKRAVNAAASRGTDAGELLDTWERLKRDTLISAVHGALSDSDGRSHALAALDLIHPDHQHEDDVKASSHP